MVLMRCGAVQEYLVDFLNRLYLYELIDTKPSPISNDSDDVRSDSEIVSNVKSLTREEKIAR